MDIHFYAELNNRDVARINGLLRKRQITSQAKIMIRDAQDYELSSQKRQKIKEILGKEPTEKLIKLLTVHAKRMNRHYQHREDLTAKSIKNRLDETIGAIHKTSELITPHGLLKIAVTHLDLDEFNTNEEYLYIERHAAIANAILEDTLEKLKKISEKLPPPKKGNRDRQHEAMMFSVLTARVFNEVEHIYHDEEMTKRERKNLILNITAQLLRLVNIRPAGVSLNTKDARDRFNAVLKEGFVLMEEEIILEAEKELLKIL